jgi:hypothetical protein
MQPRRREERKGKREEKVKNNFFAFVLRALRAFAVAFGFSQGTAQS